MLFNSFAFLIFLVVVLAFYWALSDKHLILQNLLLLVSSYIFYGWWDWRFLSLIALSTVTNYFLGLFIYNSISHSNKKFWMLISIVFNLGLLGFFKYYNFFISSLVDVCNFAGFNLSHTTLNIILPVGISFYTFQTMSYTIDIFREKLSPEVSLLNFATFVALFPQLVAGPIVRAADLIPQIRNRRAFTNDYIFEGISYIVWGFFLKIGIADSLALIVDSRFSDITAHNSASMLISVIFYAFQIYGDFAGYSYIAIGVAKLFNIHFPPNFNMPYFAINLSDFWNRWHISLSSWLRDYLYISLGGNRGTAINTYKNLMLTMMLGGLWHGASWNFLIWGFIHGIYLISYKFTAKVINFDYIISLFSIPNFIVHYLKMIFTFSLVCVTWIFFRSESLDDSLKILSNILLVHDYSFAAVQNKFHIIKGLGLIVFLITVEGFSTLVNIADFKNSHPYLAALFLAVIIEVILVFGSFSSNAFIYFQF